MPRVFRGALDHSTDVLWMTTRTDGVLPMDISDPEDPQLRAEVDYRGAFSLDGVMTSEGFRPTEINPRVSVGLGVQVGGIDDIPLGALARHLHAHPEAELDTEIRRLQAQYEDVFSDVAKEMLRR